VAGQAGPTGWISGQEPISNKKFHSFSNLFYKLQFNLNPNQIGISTTSAHTIKYKSTSSHQEKNATA
jgi:hypothetical protein